ncbi:MAG: KEOPS complex subunit Pcc1 [Euryarchaeota archaeon]|jgi:KEOPS complex subunit Pcc1|uniref:KEOPS complex subunit Pcc1 n=1 Tax=Methanobacterium sp. MZD130B TaxID=3394378 RepID=UPI0039FD6D48|nr:KEOPS complex subunit Pcc1 [Euryarchaeota archaeon]
MMKQTKTLKQVEAQIEIEFDSKKEAEIVLTAIKPEISDSPSSRTITEVKSIDKILNIDIKAQDSPSFRAALNSYFRWIMLSQEVFKLSK